MCDTGVRRSSRQRQARNKQNSSQHQQPDEHVKLDEREEGKKAVTPTEDSGDGANTAVPDSARNTTLPFRGSMLTNTFETRAEAAMRLRGDGAWRQLQHTYLEYRKAHEDYELLQRTLAAVRMRRLQVQAAPIHRGEGCSLSPPIFKGQTAGPYAPFGRALPVPAFGGAQRSGAHTPRAAPMPASQPPPTSMCNAVPMSYACAGPQPRADFQAMPVPSTAQCRALTRRRSTNTSMSETVPRIPCPAPVPPGHRKRGPSEAQSSDIEASKPAPKQARKLRSGSSRGSGSSDKSVSMGVDLKQGSKDGDHWKERAVIAAKGNAARRRGAAVSIPETDPHADIDQTMRQAAEVLCSMMPVR